MEKFIMPKLTPSRITNFIQIETSNLKELHEGKMPK